MLNVAIFGSCVSRDTAEFLPDFHVIEYVARHSLCTLATPYGQELDTSSLDSQFQKRMIATDLYGAGLKRLASKADIIDLVLVDLVDERRGYWEFPNGLKITNSIEVEAAGVGQFAEQRGGRLVKFGTDEHYEEWLNGAKDLVEGLEAKGLLTKTVFLDIEWAAALEGSRQPASGCVHYVGKIYRRLRRAFRNLWRSVKNSEDISQAVYRFQNTTLTRTEQFELRAKTANKLYRRYSDSMGEMVPAAVIRKSADVRIADCHKWGPQPFHYRDSDYESIAHSILDEAGFQL